MSDRAELSQARRIVIKIGSSSLSSDTTLIPRLASEISGLLGERRAVVVVSSGAIALGCDRLGYRSRPKEMGKLQAAAAAGQSALMRRYDEAFAQLNHQTAQVLLTHADLSNRVRLNNARNAFSELIDAGAVPIVNENDTVSTEEIKFGDNDQLAAMVVPLVGADALVLLTDVEGVLDDQGQRIALFSKDQTIGQVTGSGPRVGTGGIHSKLDAAHKAARSGANVVIARALRSGVLRELFAGDDVGTLVPREVAPLRARQHWIAFTLRPSGALLLDRGAVEAVRAGKSSLLPVGLTGVSGEFNAGDAVRLIGPDGLEVGRGLTRLNVLDAARCAGKKGDDLDNLFGQHGHEVVVVHKDDLVVVGL